MCSKWLKSVSLIIAVGACCASESADSTFLLSHHYMRSLVVNRLLLSCRFNWWPGQPMMIRQELVPTIRRLLTPLCFIPGMIWQKLYNQYISDPLTGFNLKAEVSSTQLCKVWIKIGFESYINGFFSLESGWITFQSPYPQNNGNSGLGRICDAVTIQSEFIIHTNQDSIDDVVPNKPESRRADWLCAISNYHRNTVDKCSFLYFLMDRCYTVFHTLLSLVS